MAYRTLRIGTCHCGSAGYVCARNQKNRPKFFHGSLQSLAGFFLAPDASALRRVGAIATFPQVPMFARPHGEKVDHWPGRNGLAAVVGGTKVRPG